MYRTSSRPGILIASTVIGVLAAASCSAGSSGQQGSMPHHSATMTPHSVDSSASGMEHMHGGPVPAGMQRATHPKYPTGSIVTLTADHMPGMRGARAKVVGAYDTVTYAVAYTPTTGGPVVRNHKWVVREEIENAPAKPLHDGAKVTMTADHMPGMRGAHARIVSSTTQPVYVVDYTAHGKTNKNHKWVVQDEMKPAA